MRALVLLLLWAGVAFAQTTTSTTLVKTQSAGTLTSAQGATGSGNTGIVCLSQDNGVRTLVIDMNGTSTPSASWLIEHSTAGAAGPWAVVTTPGTLVAMTAIAFSTNLTGASVALPNPVGCYRVNITTYATGSFTATYQTQMP